MGANEDQLVELRNGSLLLSSRSLATGSPQQRVQARSDDGGETFTPSFTYHGFRYVQVEGLPESYVPDHTFLTALFVRTAMPRSGRVEFGERYSILNQIQAAIVQTQASNVHAHPTDCPQREKRTALPLKPRRRPPPAVLD